MGIFDRIKKNSVVQKLENPETQKTQTANQTNQETNASKSEPKMNPEKISLMEKIRKTYPQNPTTENPDAENHTIENPAIEKNPAAEILREGTPATTTNFGLPTSFTILAVASPLWPIDQSPSAITFNPAISKADRQVALDMLDFGSIANVRSKSIAQ